MNDIEKCNECGFQYCPDIESDIDQHHKFHDGMLNGFPVRPIKGDFVVWKENPLKITLVTHNKSTWHQRNRVEKVARLAKAELNFSYFFPLAKKWNRKSNIHSYFLHRQNRLIGVIIFTWRKVNFINEWNDYGSIKSTPIDESSPTWTVEMVWLARKYRGRSLAKKLFLKSLENLKTSPSDIAWHLPFSKDGEKFVERIAPKYFLSA